MEFLKKWASCIFSFVAGALGLILSLCTGMSNSISITSTSLGINEVSESITKAHKMLTDSALKTQAETYNASTEFGWLKAFSIIMTVVSIALVIYSIVMLLKNVNVIKSNNSIFDIFGFVLAGLLLVSVIGLMISSSVYANALEEGISAVLGLKYASIITALSITVSVSVGVYQWIMLIVGIVSAIAITTLTILDRKSR